MEDVVSSQKLVRLLASQDRRRLVAALVLAEADLGIDELAARSGLSVRSVVDGLDRLVAGSAVIRVDGSGGYLLVEDLFERAARHEVPPPMPSAHADLPEDIAKVLDGAFTDGKLVQWPAKRSKRLVVLDHLAQVFEIGKRYKEREVNRRLRVFNDDVATMRRYLVDEQFLDRNSGEYWRCGGSI